MEATLEPGAEALLTTPAAGKFYRSSGATARQVQNLRVGDNATLEWLPQENIIFQGALVHLLTRVELSKNANFIGWEILCLGRPAAGERFAQGMCRQDFEIWRDGIPLYLEHSRYKGGSELLFSRWGLAGLPITASLICITHQLGLAERVRHGVGKMAAEELFGTSQLDEVLICRYLGASVERARYLFSRVWRVLRPLVAGKTVVMPRVWNT
jgi:urease accessory protein